MTVLGVPKLNTRAAILKGKAQGQMKELPAGGVIKPGHLVMINSSSQWVVHGTAKGRGLRAFADMADLIGKGLDDAYASGDVCYVWLLSSGAEVNANIAAGAAAIVAGDLLESAGDGTLRKLTADNTTGPVFGGSLIAVALAAVDNSGGGSVVRLPVVVA